MHHQCLNAVTLSYYTAMWLKIKHLKQFRYTIKIRHYTGIVKELDIRHNVKSKSEKRKSRIALTQVLDF